MRGQGLGIPWPLLGYPCPLRGSLKILESTGCSWYGGRGQWCGRLRRLWKSSAHFLREAGLEFLFTSPWLWQTLVQVSARRSLVALGRISHSCSSPWKSGHHFYDPSYSAWYSSYAMLGLTVETRSASVWVLMDVRFLHGGEHGSWSRLLSCSPLEWRSVLHAFFSGGELGS